MNTFLHSIFSHSLDDVDSRVPILTVTLGGQNWGVFPPDIFFWLQLLVGIAICVVFSILMASITYKVIIPQRGSIIASFVGVNIIIPLCILYFPFWTLDLLDVKNKLLRFCISAIYPVLIMFHTSEAMFGYSPHSVESSYKNYVLYYVAGIETQFDKSTNMSIKSTIDDKKKSLKFFISSLFILGAYKSIFGPSLYEPFETNANGNEPGYDLKDIFDINLLRNNFIITMLLQLYLTTFIGALQALVTILLGVKVKEDMMKNPMLKATSPSNFWSGRWNLVVHGVLKRGVFKPVYSVSSKFVATLATFLASGLFHEYILIAIHPTHLNFEHDYGKNTVFMMWNAGVIVLETLIGNARIFSWIKNNLPKPLVTILVICTAMPVAHWFLHPYTKSTLFVHGELAVPMIKIMVEE